MTMSKEDVEFSTGSNAFGRTASRAERRERVRQAIYVGVLVDAPFYDTGMSYAQAFRLCYGERLDRRAAAQTLPDPEGGPPPWAPKDG